MKLTVGKNMALLVATALLGLAMLTALEQYLLEKVYDGANFGNINAVPSLKVLGELRRAFLEVNIQVGRLDYDEDRALRLKIEQRLQTAANKSATPSAVMKPMAAMGAAALPTRPTRIGWSGKNRCGRNSSPFWSPFSPFAATTRKASPTFIRCCWRWTRCPSSCKK